MSITKKLVILAAAFVILTLSGVGIYGWHLSGKVTERFSSRRWSIPSKVFADTMLLYPGQRLDIGLFFKKLERMGYRKVYRQPARKGEFQITPGGAGVFLHDLETPWEQRDGFLADLEFSRDIIQSILRHDNGAAMPLVEVDPEEIALFFGPERERRRLVSIDQVPA